MNATGYLTRIDGSDLVLCATCVEDARRGDDELDGAELVAIVPGPRANSYDCEWCDEPFEGREGPGFIA